MSSHKQTVVVAIGSPLGGKSTFCEHLPNVQRQSFAEPLYRMLEVVCGRAEIRAARKSNLKDTKLPALQGKTIREALQTLGTEWGRERVGSRVWVDYLFNGCSGTPVICIDDLRFPNEYEESLKRGAVVVRMVPVTEKNTAPRKSSKKKASAKTASKNDPNSHVSESHKDGFKAHIECKWSVRQDIIDFAQSFDPTPFIGAEPTL